MTFAHTRCAEASGASPDSSVCPASAASTMVSSAHSMKP